MAGALDLFQGHTEQPALRYVAFDTRFISHAEQTLFVALRGPRRSGLDFIPQAMEKGVRNFLTDSVLPFSGINYILTDNSLDALQRWAATHRQRFGYPVLAITGSNGKTTVKEWLCTLLEQRFQVVKSPMSYNSQLGVALSLLKMQPQAQMAIIEAGISQRGEMAVLQAMIQPTIGLFTHFGAAHAEGFSDEAEKLAEKCRLFEGAERLFCSDRQPEVMARLQQTGAVLEWTGESPGASLKLLHKEATAGGWRLRVELGGSVYTAALQQPGEAALDNALLAMLAAWRLGLPPEEICLRLPLLGPVEMRSEWISDNPEITILNDAYNSDPDAIRNALQLLLGARAQPRRALILSDLLHQGAAQEAVQRQLLAEAEQALGAEQVWTIGPVFARIRHFQCYADTADFIRHFQYEPFRNSTVLLKGARDFGLEQLIPLLQRKPNAAVFELNLNALSNNLRYLRSRLPRQTRIMGMVKALSYGGGTWEIARVLEREGVDYLAVAYISEGIALREKGINLPIMVMNPDMEGLSAMAQYELEPQIYSISLLHAYVRAARLAGAAAYRIHLKLETGMGRLGFVEAELEELSRSILQYPDLQVVSVLSHLAASDEPAEDAFSHEQAARFLQLSQYLSATLGIQPLRHLLNTAGALRFPEYAFDMVRIGIGLYGVDPAADAEAGYKLEEVGGLHAPISQIREYPAGLSIGYGRAQYTTEPARIATLPIGYADGVLRCLGEGKAQFLLHGKRVPTFGRICMDMLMLDVSGVPEARPGDRVTLFGAQEGAFLSVREIAGAAGTIPYEILTRISPRVRRVYVSE